MPLQNRVLPTGDIVAVNARGTLTGNRGILHDQDKQLSNRRWAHHAWIYCELEWKNRRRNVMSGRNWTELFFLDEAVALAAGHRPCGYCKRGRYSEFKAAWSRAYGMPASAKQMDALLQSSRVIPGSRKQLTTQLNATHLPDGAMFSDKGKIYLISGGLVRQFSEKGYGAVSETPQHVVDVLTPMPILHVLRAGFKVSVHKSAS